MAEAKVECIICKKEFTITLRDPESAKKFQFVCGDCGKDYIEQLIWKGELTND